MYITFETLISFIISIIALVIAFFSYRQSKKTADLSKPQLKFHYTKNCSYFRKKRPEEKMYDKSNCLSFVYVSISNYSNLPISIRQAEINVPGYQIAYCSGSTHICLDNYILIGGKNQSYQDSNGVHVVRKAQPTHQINSKNMISLPHTLKPYGYIEGYFLFTHSPLYQELCHESKIKVITTRGDFESSFELFPVSAINKEI